MSSPGRSSSGAELLAAVEVHLRAGPAGAGRARLPEVLRARQLDDPLLGNALRAPELDRLGVGAEAELLVALEDGDPDAARGRGRGRSSESSQPKAIASVLEVVADREVAEHLEEGQVAGGLPDLLDVGRAKAALAGGRAGVRGGSSRPRKYGLSGCIPAVVSSTEGSCEDGTSEADGRRRCPRSSK